MARGDINSSNAGRQQRGGVLGGGDAETLIVQVLKSRLNLTPENVQRIQSLLGDRFQPGDGATRPAAAVTRDNLSAIGRMKPMKSVKLTAAPTMTDYNNLRDDVRAIYDALAAVVNALDGSFSA